MSQQLIAGRRRKHSNPLARRRIRAAFEPSAGGASGELPFPGIQVREPESSRRTLVSGSLATLMHAGIVGALVLAASLAPVLDEELIPVQLLQDAPEPAEPAPAPKALAERRSLDYAPALQAVQPQIINPQVVADAVPRVEAQALQMDAVSSVAAPTQIARAPATVVERVSAVRSVAAARPSAVDIASVGGPVVRGPIRAQGPVGPSVGPRQVAATPGTTTGKGTLQIGGGSSVREGVLSSRDVAGSPGAAPLANVNTAVGQGNLRGAGEVGGTGTANVGTVDCFRRREVQSYLGGVETRTLDRWVLPPGVEKDQRVTLRFHIDVAGSATKVELVRASNNALGVSAIDALRAASPFPPMPEPARCLARVPIVATFSNPGAG